MTYYRKKIEDKLYEEASKYRIYCQCGHSVVIYPTDKNRKKLCSWCKKYVFVNENEEFKYRMSEMLKKGKKENI